MDASWAAFSWLHHWDRGVRVATRARYVKSNDAAIETRVASTANGCPSVRLQHSCVTVVSLHGTLAESWHDALLTVEDEVARTVAAAVTLCGWNAMWLQEVTHRA